MNRTFHAPHWRGGATEDAAPNAALLIDFDNVTMAMRSNLAHELRRLLNSDIIRGKVAVQRAYADWRRYPQYIVPLSEASIDLIFAPAYGSSKKNATDIRLAIDALELVFTRPEIGTYILLSGDSDFSSLVLKLKEYGKYVIGVGLQESSSDILVQNCDEYYSYTTLSGLTSAADMQRERLDPFELAEKALARMVERSDVMRSDRLKQVMLELDPSFDEKSLGFTKFNRFLAEAASREIVKLRKGENGQYEVQPAGRPRQQGEGAPDRPRVSRSRRRTEGNGRREGRGRGGRDGSGREEPGVATRTAGGAVEEAAGREVRGGSGASEPRRRSASEGVTASALRAAYRLLARVVETLAGGGEPVRDSEVKRRMLAEDEQFDEAQLGFRKFSRFLQQARDEGVVDVAQGEDGNYYLTPVVEPAGGRAGGRPGRPRRAGRDAPRQDREATAAPPAEQKSEGTPAPSEEEAPAPAAEEERPPTDGGERARAAGPGEAPSAGPEEAPARVGRAARGLGRFRRGSRGASLRPSAPAPSEIGPVRLPGEPEEKADGGRRSASAAGRSETGAEDGEERTVASEAGRVAARRPASLGRFRRGSRGRVPGSGPISGDQAIQHMVDNYPGVGRRTAARLVEEFGEEVFRVIDREPSRVSDVLSAGRARAVLEAREAEREAASRDEG